MTGARRSLPTLTEVIEVRREEPATPLAPAPESVALDDSPSPPASPTVPLQRLQWLDAQEAQRLVDAVVERLQPRLEAWVRAQLDAALRDALQERLRAALQQGLDASAADMARRLRSELPTLARAALDEARPDGFES